MVLKSKKVEGNIVDSNDFDRFVNKIYGGDYEFVAYHEAENYTCYKFEVPNMNMPWAVSDDAVRKGVYSTRDTHRLFRCLYEDGHLPKGIYFINVSW